MTFLMSQPLSEHRLTVYLDSAQLLLFPANIESPANSYSYMPAVSSRNYAYIKHSPEQVTFSINIMNKCS